MSTKPDGYVRKDWRQMLESAVGYRQSAKIYPRQNSNNDRAAVCLVKPEYKDWAEKVRVLLNSDTEYFHDHADELLDELAELSKY